MLSQSLVDGVVAMRRVCGCTVVSGIIPKLKGWQLQTDGKACLSHAAFFLCPLSPFVLLICLFLVSIQSRVSWARSVERPRHNMMATTDERDTMGQDPPGVLQGACSSRMPGMAQGSQWHEPPTLNKRLAVVPGLDPVSSWDTYGAQTGEP